MAIWQPIINCGLDAGNSPAVFTAEFSNKHGFATEAECDEWINNNSDNFTFREMGGGIYPQSVEIENPLLI